MITKEQAVAATWRQELQHVERKDSRGHPIVCRVNGKCQTWKTRPNEFRLPVKIGFKGTCDITERNAADWVMS